LDGGLVGGGLNLHHSLDDGLNEKLMLGLQVRGGSLDLLSERNEGVLQLDEGEITERSIVVVSLGIFELGDGFLEDESSILVVILFRLVDLFDVGEVVGVLLERSLVIRKSLLSIGQVSLVFNEGVVEVVQGSFTIGNFTSVLGDIGVELSFSSLVRRRLLVEQFIFSI